MNVSRICDNRDKISTLLGLSFNSVKVTVLLSLIASVLTISKSNLFSLKEPDITNETTFTEPLELLIKLYRPGIQ